MKKITWLFLSLMLLFGFGVAFADGETEGGGETTPTTVAAPTFDKADGFTFIYKAKDATVALSTTESGDDVEIRYTYGAAPKDPTATTGTKYTNPISIRKGQTIKAITVKGDQISDVVSATYKVKLSETTLEPATGETIKQGAEIACTIPEELTGATNEIFLIYVEGDDTDTELETDGDVLETMVQSLFTISYGQEPRYPNLGTDYKVAVYSPDFGKWFFPITAPEENGPFKIRARAVIDASSTGDLVYGDEMTATYTVEGEKEGGEEPTGVGLPVFSVAEGEVDAGTELILKPTNAETVLYAIDDEDVELTYDNFASFKCFMYTDDAPIKIYKGQTIRAVSGKILSASQFSVTMEYSDVKTVTYTVKGGDQTDKMPTLTITPEVLKVAQGGSVTFSCTMDPKNYEEKIGFAFRGKTATTEGIKLEYRLDETSDWTEYTEAVLADLYNAVPIAAIPNNEDFTAEDEEGNPYVVDARVCDNTKGARTVYYRLTVSSIVPPVMAVELGYVDDKGKYITIANDANNYAPLARIPLNIEVFPAAPTFSVEAGEVEKGTKVELTCITADAGIHYTVDGSEPTAESTEYTAEISIDSAMTIKAIAVKGEDTSNVVEAAYTIKGEGPVVEEKDTLPMPKFSVAAGAVEKGTTVVLSCDTADAKIYYSINADTVTANSLEYTEAIAIDSAMTIRAIAVKEGLENSPVAVAAYTIKGEGTANEGKELTGVSVYPNPSTGVFHIELPVAATVEVFAGNGVLVRSFNAAAGKSTLSLDHSGIYFVRIMGEGRATVKRVIVR